MRYTVAELQLLSRLSAREGVYRANDAELRDTHQEAVEYAKQTGGPVRGVCPTMFHNHDEPVDGVDCVELSKKLSQHAKDLEQGGPHR